MYGCVTSTQLQYLELQNLNPHLVQLLRKGPICFIKIYGAFCILSQLQVCESKEESEVAGFFVFSQKLFSYFQPLRGALTLRGTHKPLPNLKYPIIRICENTKKPATSDTSLDSKFLYSLPLKYNQKDKLTRPKYNDYILALH